MFQDDEVNDLKDKINVIRDMSISAGINVDHVIRSSSPALQRRHTFNTEQQQNGKRDTSMLQEFILI